MLKNNKIKKILDCISAFMTDYGLYAAWMLSCVGTIVSLFYSMYLGYKPCSFCWYQRVCLFPMPIILGIAAYNNFKKIVLYLIPLAIVGAIIALYQIVVQEFGLHILNVCGFECEERHTVLFNFLTFPMLSLANFLVLIAIFLFKSKETR